MTRRLSRISSLALAITALAVPSAAVADTPTVQSVDAHHAALVNRGGPYRSPISPRAFAAIDRVSPDARDGGRREPAPVIVKAPTVVASDGFDWTDAGLGAAAVAALLALAAGAATLTRRHAVRPS
jgi:hypothetical protein